ncbi:MAG: murein biosynthesis integral membrane protein MurJ [Betaproteobacteria bacterium]|jgi:putative peptidoglycan lipid II flippase|nr:murein biosynthesis integral membrane protein MurJ [Pseudomonadota bacterium]NBO04340.1 murein biosynthesis integral membrane protein MurJ [Betaproteobacteria bacterium]NBP34502.1 murein biosynthesis integral membrane protein MurJ [Betaproteobacteria bacterium]NBP37290.1 murein biosynthesis integral membrane protein MurJ [Betaproteobacteria bacterium]NBQ77681.1 murein biosynthesis integral membrane protein MurJ [Betaproteobacteria bacterium]
MSLFRSAALVSVLTLVSRITGLLRENLTAVLFGSNAMTDAFFVAFRLPNLLRRLFAEGAFSQAFVPMLAQARQQGDDAAYQRFIEQTASLMFWFLLALSLVGAVAAPLLVWMMAGGLATDAAAMMAATEMARWMFPYILPISLVAFASGVLHAENRFAVPAFTPVLLNLSMICAALAFHDRVDPPVFALSIGVVIGALLQLGLQWWALAGIGRRPSIALRIKALREAWQSAATRSMLARMAPAVLAVSAAQVSLIFNTHIASTLGPGRVSWVSFADRLMEFPTALLGVALGTVLLPGLSKARAEQDTISYSKQLDWGLRLSVLLAIPSAIGLGLMAEPLTALLYHYGRFSEHDVVMTAQAAAAYAAGLLGLIGVKVLAPGFYAQQDVQTPVKIALAMLVLTQALNTVTVPWLEHAGLALSISLAALCNALLLLFGLLRRQLYIPEAGWWRFLGQVLGANLVMAALLAWAAQQSWLQWQAMAATPWLRAFHVLWVILAAAGLYFISLRILGVHLMRLIKR